MKTQANYIIMFDFETGGLPSKDTRAFYDIAAIEIALVVIDLRTLSIVEEKSFIFEDEYKEGLTYSKEAEDVHGITKEIRLSKGTDLKTIYKEIVALLKKYKNPRQLCNMGGHNISFDIPFLRNFFLYMKDDIDNYVKFWTDTLLWAHMASLEQENYQLHTCCVKYGIDLVNAHRALDDTKANAYLMIEFIKRLRGQGSDGNQGAALVDRDIVRFRDKFEL